MVIVDRSADCKTVVQRGVNHHVDLRIVIIAVSHIDRTRDTIKIRTVGDDVDDTRCRVATKQGALRPAQNFDAVDIVKTGFEGLWTGNIDAINHERSRGIALFCAIRTAHTANCDLYAIVTANRQARHLIAQIGGIGDACGAQSVPTDCRHGNRGLGQQCFVAGCGNDYVAMGWLSRLSRLILSKCGCCEQRQNRRGTY